MIGSVLSIWNLKVQTPSVEGRVETKHENSITNCFVFITAAAWKLKESGGVFQMYKYSPRRTRSFTIHRWAQMSMQKFSQSMTDYSVDCLFAFGKACWISGVVEDTHIWCRLFSRTKKFSWADFWKRKVGRCTSAGGCITPVFAPLFVLDTSKISWFTRIQQLGRDSFFK